MIFHRELTEFPESVGASVPRCAQYHFNGGAKVYYGEKCQESVALEARGIGCFGVASDEFPPPRETVAAWMPRCASHHGEFCTRT